MRQPFFSTALLLLAAPAFLQADEINFGVIAHAESIDIEATVASGLYGSIDGIAKIPGGDIIAVHSTTTFRETFVRVNSSTEAVSVTKTDTQILADLGTSFGPSLVLDSGMAIDPIANKLYFVDTFSGEVALLAMDLSTNVVSVVLRDVDLFEAQDLAVLPSGEVILVIGDQGVGMVDPAAGTPVWQLLVTEAQLQAVLSTTDGVPAEAVGVNPATGDVWIFAHDVDALFKIENIKTAPVLTHFPSFEGFDLHDLVVDSNGIVYGFNEAGAHLDHVGDGTEDAIVIFDPVDDHIHVWSLHDISEALEGASSHSLKGKSAERNLLAGEEVAVTLWRGLAVESGTDEVAIYIANGNDAYGIVVLEFTTATSAGQWAIYN